mmetsp:Transcript_16474/g.52724  ORF Transcript_16474/g.52724 Transcript_16474/m.52724 type:complete len:338 (-) Transcript_16474:366-1379(-)
MASLAALLAVAGLSCASAGAVLDPLEAALAAELNADFLADPLAPGSPLGVLVRWSGDFNFYCDTNCSDSLEHSDAHDAYASWADCRTDATLLNHAWSVSIGLCPDASNNTIMVPPRATGWVYNRSVLSTSVRCSYASDVGSRFRVNHGCGCDYDDQGFLEGRSYENACKNVDPWTGERNTPTGRLVSSCRCSSPLQQPGPTGEYNCFWEGPRFYEGHGEDQIQQMVRQRMNYPEHLRWHCEPGHPEGAWTEVVLDPRALESQQRRDFSATIPALVVSGGAATREQVCDYMKPVMRTYGLQACPPVLGFEVGRPSNPFFALPKAGAAGAALAGLPLYP